MKVNELWVFVAVAIMVAVGTASTLDPAVHLAGISLYWPDLLCCYAMAEIVSTSTCIKARLGVIREPVVALALLVVLSLVRGFAAFGQSAGQESRSFVWVLALAVYMVGRPHIHIASSRFLKVWLLLGLVLSVVCIYKWITVGVGTSNQGTFVNGEYESARALTAGQALIVAQACLIAISAWVETRLRRHAVQATVLFVTTIVLQHRTVWVVLAVTVLALVAFDATALMRRAVVGILCVLMVASPFIFYGSVPGLFAKLSDSASTISTTHGTFADRVQSWVFLVEANASQGLGSILFGRPFGSGYGRVLGGRYESYGPHNYYVQAFLRIGILGMIAFLILMAATLKRALDSTASEPSRALAVCLWGTVAIYCVAYPLDWTQGLIVGLLLALPVSGRPAEILKREVLSV